MDSLDGFYPLHCLNQKKSFGVKGLKLGLRLSGSIVDGTSEMPYKMGDKNIINYNKKGEQLKINMF